MLAAEVVGVPAPQRSELATHLEHCPDCSMLVSRGRGALTSADQRRAASRVAASRVPGELPKTRRRQPLWHRAAVAAALAVIALATAPAGRPPRNLRGGTLAPAAMEARAHVDSLAQLAAAEVGGGDALAAAEVLERADAALALWPDQEPALFARALSLERLGLSKTAAAAWRSYIQLPGRAAEGERHLAAIAAASSPLPQAVMSRQPLGDEAAAELQARGRALWVRGVDRAREGDFGGGIVDYRAAIAVYERLGDRDIVAWLQFLVGEAYGYLGITAEGWRLRQQALTVLPRLSNGERASLAFVNAAILALLEERPHVAAELLEEAIAGDVDGTPYQRAHALLWRSRVRLALDDGLGSREDLQRAASWMRRASPRQRRDLSGHLELAQGMLTGDSSAAIADLTRAAAAFDSTARSAWLPVVLFERARAHVRAGDLEAADLDLRRGLELVVEQEALARGADLWASRLAGSDRLIDERVRLAIARGRAVEAYAIAEEGRARVLRAGGAPLSPADIRARLDRDVTLLTYAVLPDRVVLWRTSQHGVTQVPLSISPGELRRLTTSLTSGLAGGAWTSGTKRIARRLHAALIAPGAPASGPLVIVPDEELHAVPFAAFIDERGRYLIEEHELTMAPSAAVYLRSRDRWRSIAAPPNDALVVGDPQHRSLLELRTLPRAREEARRVAALYPRRQLLLGAAATRPAFLAALGRSTVLHVAGHARSNSVLPQRSSLVLAGDDRALLYAAEIAELQLPATSTVVLSACETATGPPLRGEGPASLARAFLATGVPSVVASLWAVDDATATPLLTAFHRELRAGERPAAALRQGQLQLLGSGDRELRSPAAWATFVALGG